MDEWSATDHSVMLNNEGAGARTHTHEVSIKTSIILVLLCEMCLLCTQEVKYVLKTVFKSSSVFDPVSHV